MPFYPGDYLADTRHLTTQEHGAYLLLIMHYWRTGGLPSDDARLALIAGLTHDEWSSSRGVISAFFNDDWQHKRIEHELAEAERISAAGRAGGLASGKARLKRTTVERPLNDDETKRQPSQPQSHSEPRGSDAVASAQSRIWTEGKPALMALGVSEKQSGPMIGRWLKDAGDDHETVLRTILRARDACPMNPIPWITQSLKAKPNGKSNSVIAAIDTLGERLAEFNRPAPSELRGGTGPAPVRAISQGRGK